MFWKIIPEQEKKNFLEEFINFIKDLFIIILVVWFVRTFLVMPFQISWSSMDESYYDREFIIVDRFSYLNIPLLKKGNPNRWDVVVFRPHVNPDKKYFIKRVIWLPWETVKIENGKVYLLSKDNDSFLELIEWYLSPENKNSTFVVSDSEAYIYEIPKWSYFVMWDNRNHSTDSRTCFSNCNIEWRENFIKKEYITWKVWLDLGYYDWLRLSPKVEFWTFKFIHPTLWIETKPRWFSFPKDWEYN